MALDIFGALGALARILPGYVQGERQAIEDNWQDMNQYNQVLQGQMQNAFAEETFDPAVQMFNIQRDNAANQALNLQMATMGQLAQYPGYLLGRQLQGQLLPYSMPAQTMAQFGQMIYPWLNMNSIGQNALMGYGNLESQLAALFNMANSQQNMLGLPSSLE